LLDKVQEITTNFRYRLSSDYADPKHLSATGASEECNIPAINQIQG